MPPSAHVSEMYARPRVSSTTMSLAQLESYGITSSGKTYSCTEQFLSMSQMISLGTPLV